MNRAITLLASALAGAVVAGAVVHYLKSPAEASKPAEVATDVKGEIKRSAAIKSVRVYRPAVKRSLNLPASILADPSEQVVAAAKVPADDRSHTVTTTINTDTGEAQAFDRRDPLPWLALDTRGEIGLAYGYKRSEQVARLSLRQDLVQIKALHLGAQANMDSDGEWFAGIGVWYRW